MSRPALSQEKVNIVARRVPTMIADDRTPVDKRYSAPWNGAARTSRRTKTTARSRRGRDASIHRPPRPPPGARVDGIFFSDFEQGEIGPDLFRHACLMG